MKKYRDFIPISKVEENYLLQCKTIKKLSNIFIVMNLILFSFIITKSSSNDEVDDFISTDTSKESSYNEILNYIDASNDICEFMLVENGKGTMIIYDLESLNEISKFGKYIIRSKENQIYEVKFE